MAKRPTVGLLGGSFDPVHVGHLMVASFVAQEAGLDEVWLSLSPSNPLKTERLAAPDADRLAMLSLATPPGHNLKAVDFELSLPRPSFTSRYLDHLTRQFPDIDFKLIIGSDNWLIFDRWKDSEHILDRYGVIVYPRPGYPLDAIDDSRATLVKAPTVDISSTFIRNAISQGLDMNFFLPPGVYNYIKTHNLYQ